MSDLAGGFWADSVGRGSWKTRAVLVVGVGVPLGVVASAAPAAADGDPESEVALGAGAVGDWDDPSDRDPSDLLAPPEEEYFGEDIAKVTEAKIEIEGFSGPSDGFELREENGFRPTITRSWVPKPVYGGVVETKNVETRDSWWSVLPRRIETRNLYEHQDGLWPDRHTTRTVTKRSGDVSRTSDREIRDPARIVRVRETDLGTIRDDTSTEQSTITGGLPGSPTASIVDEKRHSGGSSEVSDVKVWSGPDGPEIEVGFFSGANGEYDGQDLIWDGETAQTRPRRSTSSASEGSTDRVWEPAEFDRLGDAPVKLISGVEGTAVLHVGNTVAAAGPLGSATFTRNPDGSSEVAYAGTNGEAVRSIFDGEKHVVSVSDRVGSDEYVVR